MAGLLQHGGGDLAGQCGPGWASMGLVCPCYHVRSATEKAVEAVPSPSCGVATLGHADSLLLF
jgi:hypothetical protein